MTIGARSILLTALAISAASYSPALVMAATSADAATYAQRQQVVCGLQSNPKLLAILKKNPDYERVTCEQSAAKSPPAQNKPTKPVQIATSHNSNPAGSPSQNLVPHLLVRNSWSDLGWLGGGCMAAAGGGGVSAAGSKGASASFTRDYANNNKIWAAQGMVAGVLTDCPGVPLTSDYTGPFGSSLAIYGQLNTTYDSNPQLAKKNNADTRTAGLAAEGVYVDNGDFNVFRVMPNVVFDNINNTTAGAVMAQYAPAWVNHYIWRPLAIFGRGPSFQFDPVFDLQYASAMEHSKPLQFSGKDQSLRLGPELTFILTPYSSGNDFWNAIGFSETFHPWLEVYNTRASSYWWDNSIFYNITENLAVKLSYDRGRDENSGAMTNQYILSLAGKY